MAAALEPQAAPVAPGTHFRQGDVLLVAVEPGTVPDAAVPVARDHGRIVLAEGEATGHAHAILARPATLLRAGTGDAAPRFLRVTTAVDLVHEEHAPIALPEGTYRVVIQREYVPPELSSTTFRRVVD